MSEFLRSIPDAELVNLAKMAEDGHGEASEAFIREELYRRQQERLASLALSSGVYDASQDTYETQEHPEDDTWVVRGED